MSNPSLVIRDRVVNQRQVPLFELHVHHRPDDLDDFADFLVLSLPFRAP